MQPSWNSAQNNELQALYARYWEAPESKRPAIEREIDALLGCGTRRTDALERKTVSFKEGHAGAQVFLGDPTELMKARIARHDAECQGDQFVGGWGFRGFARIAKLTGDPPYTTKQLKPKIRAPSSSFLIAVDAHGRFIDPSSVSCVNSVFWATCPLSGKAWGGDLRIETSTNRQGMVPGWFADRPSDVSGGSGW
jgi:hypothetical protein